MYQHLAVRALIFGSGFVVPAVGLRKFYSRIEGISHTALALRSFPECRSARL